jgi:hypothetical protein
LTLRTAKTGLVATRVLRPLPLHTPPRVLFTRLRVGSEIEPPPREDDGKAVCRVSDGTGFRAWLADPWFVSKAVPLPQKGTPLGIDCYRLYAIPRFAGQPISGAFGPDLQTTMSVTEIVANEQVLRHNGIGFAGVVGRSNNEVELHVLMSTAALMIYPPTYSMS